MLFSLFICFPKIKIVEITPTKDKVRFLLHAPSPSEGMYVTINKKPWLLSLLSAVACRSMQSTNNTPTVFVSRGTVMYRIIPYEQCANSMPSCQQRDAEGGTWSMPVPEEINRAPSADLRHLYRWVHLSCLIIVALLM